MSLIDIRVAAGLLRHPKFRKLSKRIGVEALHLLVSLWIFVAECRPSGVLTDITGEDIEVAVDWSGAPGEYVKTLLELRWLDRDDAGVFSLHDWAIWQPWVVGAPERSEAARRAAEARWKETNTTRGRGPSSRDARGKRAAQKGNAPSLSSPSQASPTPTLPNQQNESSRASDSFERFFATYGLVAGRDQAEKEWQKLDPSPELVELIVTDCRVRYRVVAKQFRPRPAKYLAEKRWQDEIVPRTREPRTASSGQEVAQEYYEETRGQR
jgi:hypothetical protein